MAARFSRRALVVVGAAGAAIGWTELVWPRLAGLLEPGPDFTPIAGLPGYRKLTASGSMSGGFADPFAGIALPESSAIEHLPPARMPDNPCQVLYRGPQTAKVPLAVFTDFNCPYCRVLDQRLLDLAEARGDEVSLAIHQLPLLGESSVWAARGALAAGQQDAYIAFHKRLMGAAFAIGPDYLVAVASRLGLDGDRLMQDAMGQVVTDQLAASRAFAARLGIVGTPGLLVGRSLVLGSVSDRMLDRLIRLEATEATPPNCAAFA